MNFHTSKEKGKIGETLFRKLLNSRDCVVIDTSEKAYFQKEGIDFVVENKLGEVYLVDVKTQFYPAKYFFAETISNTNTNSPGCLYTTAADFWFLYYVHDDYAVVVHPPDLQALIAEEKDNLREVEANTEQGGRIIYSSCGFLVPLESTPRVLHFENIAELL